MPLTDLSIRGARPRDRDYKLGDQNGLYLLVRRNGSRLWRLKYRFERREKLLALGKYPEISLKEARDLAIDHRRQVAKGVDPAAVRRAAKTAIGDNFKDIALDWFDRFMAKKAENHKSKVLARLENDLFPWLGSRPIRNITAPDVLACLRRIEERGALDTAHRTRQTVSQIFQYATAMGLAESDPAAPLKRVIPRPESKNFPTILEPEEIGELLRAIDAYTGTFVVKCAARLSPYVFVRPGELRAAEWSEFDFERALWTIPAAKMKKRKIHLVPLSRQALAILQEIKPLTENQRFVFASRSDRKPFSENTLNAMLRRIGYEQGTFTMHGFRSMASTHLNGTLKFRKDPIERQLAHVDENPTRDDYNHAEYLEERVEIMQAWADHLDKLRATKKRAPSQLVADAN